MQYFTPLAISSRLMAERSPAPFRLPVALPATRATGDAATGTSAVDRRLTRAAIDPVAGFWNRSLDLWYLIAPAARRAPQRSGSLLRFWPARARRDALRYEWRY